MRKTITLFIALAAVTAAGFITSSAVSAESYDPTPKATNPVPAEDATPATCCPDGKPGEVCPACQAKAAETKPIFLGNSTCPIMGGKTDPKQSVEYADPKTHTYAKIHVCCPGCLAAVKKNPAAAYKKAYLDREIKDENGKIVVKKGQPLDLKNTTCPIMGGKVSQYSVVYDGYKIGLCCPGCEEKFAKAPEKYLTELIKKEKLTLLDKKHAAAHHLNK